MRGLLSRLREERGISAVIVAVSLVGIFGAAMLSVDAGSLWTTRRSVITGTDSAALAAAQFFVTGGGDPCNATDVATAESIATNELLKNNPGYLHNATDTPNGFQVTLSNSTECATPGFHPGDVRFDARAISSTTVGRLFGFSNPRAFSSSTAQFGWITQNPIGIRPIAVCDKGSNFLLWEQLHPSTGNPTITQSQYYSNYGSGPTYPTVSDASNNNNPNGGLTYHDPRTTTGFGLVNRITMPDPTCGTPPGNRIWVDYTGVGGSNNGGTSDLATQILSGYSGDTSLTPHDCNPDNSTAPPEDCGVKTGNSGGASAALGTVTCPVDTPTMQCPYIFPVLVVSNNVGPGNTAAYAQAAYLTVVLRGFGKITSTNVQFDLEFVDIQWEGNISWTTGNSDSSIKGIGLCGVDNDTQPNRCGA